jgi:hypothetical protein
MKRKTERDYIEKFDKADETSKKLKGLEGK